jgi:hypothetical protein
MYTQTTPCTTSSFIVYFDQTNCQNTSADFAGAHSYASCGANSYTMSFNGVATYYGSCFSDERTKGGIQTLTNSLESLMKMEVYEYDWNSNIPESDYEYYKRKGKLHSIGLIAQNVRQYYPEVVYQNNEGYYSINYAKLNSVLVEAIKEQQVFIDDIKIKIDELEKLIDG